MFRYQLKTRVHAKDLLSGKSLFGDVFLKGNEIRVVADFIENRNDFQLVVILSTFAIVVNNGHLNILFIPQRFFQLLSCGLVGFWTLKDVLRFLTNNVLQTVTGDMRERIVHPFNTAHIVGDDYTALGARSDER